MTVQSFKTELGVVVPAVTVEQMREVDRVAIEETGPNLFQMMENAGRNLALTVMDELGSGWASEPVCVLAGTGGNGGGGICAARHLANRGADVTVVVSKPEELKPTTQQQFDLFKQTGGRIEDHATLESLESTLIVDALVGYQLSGPITGVVLEMVDWVAAQHSAVVALDVPSGVDATTGQIMGSAVHAKTTLTLALPKTGLDVAAVGALLLADIGITAEVYKRVGIDVSPDTFGANFRTPIQPMSRPGN